MLLIYYLSSQNGEQTTEVSLSASKWLVRLLGEKSDAETVMRFHGMVRKAAHVILFSGLGISTYLLMFYGALSRQNRYRVVGSIVGALCITAGYGYFDEWHKQFIDGRHFQMEEVMLNILSATVGVVAACCLNSFRKRRL